MSRLLLTRHAESEWNALGRWQGQADPPLSEQGRRQAAAAAAAVGMVDAIVSSTLERAAHTAAIIAETVGVGPVLAAPDLVERDAGPWSGLTKAEIEVDYPGYLAAERRPDGYEPDRPFLERILAGLSAIRAAGPGREVLVVTQAGVIYAREAHRGFAFERIPNLGGRWIEVDEGGLSAGDRLLRIDPDSTTLQEPETL